MIGFTVAKRLWLGLALMLALLAAAYLLSLRASRTLQSPLSDVVAGTEARRSAAAEMQGSLDEMSQAVNDYRKDRDPKRLAAIKEAEKRFETASANYQRLASTQENQALSRETAERYARYKAQTAEVVHGVDGQTARLATYGGHQQEIKALLSGMPPVSAPRRADRTAAAKNLSAALRDRSQELAPGQTRVEALRRTAQGPESVGARLARYRAVATTRTEREWAKRAGSLIAEGDKQISGILAAEQAQQRAVADAAKLRQDLNAHLLQRVQTASKAELSTTLNRTTASVHNAIERLSDGLLAAFGLGVLIAVGTVFAVRAPLRKLAVATRGYVDADLTFRTFSTRADEAGELEWALDSMAKELESARQSRAASGAAATAPPAERPADESQRTYAAIAFEQAKQAIVVTDDRLGIASVNPAFTELSGYSLDDVQGKQPGTLWSPDHHDTASVASVWTSVDEQGQWHGEIRIRGKGGEFRPVWAAINAVRDPQGRLQNAILAFSDLMAIRIADESRNHPGYLDPLSGLPAGAILQERLGAALRRAQRHGAALALLRVSLDKLEGINDTLGPEEGNRLMHTAAERLKACVRANDLVGRIGAQEFVLVLEDLRKAREAARLADKILSALSVPVKVSGLELPIHASIGVALAPSQDATVDELLATTETALSRAREAHRGSWAFSSPDVTAHVRERLTLETALRQPGLQEQLVLHYQPQLSAATGRVVGVEALLRWQHPERGLLHPGEFLPVAEEVGAMDAISDWTLREACAQAKRWIDSGVPPLRVAVNLSEPQIKSERLVRTVESALHSSGFDPQLLQLELSEAALHDAGEAAATLGRLQHLGVGLTLEHCQAGDTAFNTLTWLPFRRVKFDSGTSDDATSASNGHAASRRLIALARSLQLEIVAERVETEEQAVFLRAEGCDELQGYLIGAPMPAQEFEGRLRPQAGTAGGAVSAAHADAET